MTWQDLGSITGKHAFIFKLVHLIHLVPILSVLTLIYELVKIPFENFIHVLLTSLSTEEEEVVVVVVVAFGDHFSALSRMCFFHVISLGNTSYVALKLNSIV